MENSEKSLFDYTINKVLVIFSLLFFLAAMILTPIWVNSSNESRKLYSERIQLAVSDGEKILVYTNDPSGSTYVCTEFANGSFFIPSRNDTVAKSEIVVYDDDLGIIYTYTCQ